jgi:hypothetical protein
MTVSDTARRWLSRLDIKAYGSLMLFVTLVVAITVFGVLPTRSLLFVNAFLSGSVLTMCVGIIAFGADKVRAGYLAASCLLAGGLITSIPAMFYDHSVVDWGSTVSRLGLAVLFVQVILDLERKWKEEKA